MKFSIEDFFKKLRPNLQETVDLVTFTEKKVYRNLHFLCSGAFKVYPDAHLRFWDGIYLSIYLFFI